MDAAEVVDRINWEKDVDGFHVRNVGELAKRSGQPLFLPCTAAGVLRLIESAGVSLRGTRAAVVGRSDIVGMPVFQLLQKSGATVTLLHTQSRDVQEETRRADVLVVAAGQREQVDETWIKPGATVIDVGIHSDGHGKLVGDCRTESVAKVAGKVTPVPGGVGPMTVALLLENTVKSAERQLNQKKSMHYTKLQLKDPVPSDEEISRIVPKPALKLAEEIGILRSEVQLYGEYKAKVSLSLLDRLKSRALDGADRAQRAKMVVVTGVNPTQFGEGKTTTLLGLVQALNVQMNRLTFGTLRQPSQGPTFGIKGGAAGGGYSQVIPMADVNLHLTGDIHAVTAANNLLCAAVDARVLHERSQKTGPLYRRLVPKGFVQVQLDRLRRLGINKTDPKDLTPEEIERFSRLNIDPKTISVRRVIDCNDRFLRGITIGQGSGEAGFERQTGFDIAVASEVMAILALAKDAEDLKRRLKLIVVARDSNGNPITVDDIGCGGAMAALMNDAIMPNLLQSLEGTPIFMHAGPFANVAHGQSSILADEMALRLAGPDGFCVTESGFGADMGFEKFVAIKSRASGVAPDCAVLVASVRALRMHGEVLLGEEGAKDRMKSLEVGCINMRRHIRNVRTHYGTPVVVAITRPTDDSPEEHKILEKAALEEGAYACVPTYGWSHGSKGAAPLAKAVMEVCDKQTRTPELRQLYNVEDSIEQKIRTVAQKIYGASDISLSPEAREQIDWITRSGLHKVPICMAKTPLSFSHDPEIKGAPEGFVFPVTSVRVSAGAGFVYPLAGAMQTMPGLSTRPGFFDIDVDKEGVVKGLF